MSSSGLSPSLIDLTARIEANRFLRSRWFDGWCLAAQHEISIGVIATIILATKALFGMDKGQWSDLRAIKRILRDRVAFRDEVNDQIVQSVIQANEAFFDNIEKYPLTPRQREAVASDEDATLVIAGAGTGKTSTILAKIGLLLKTGQCGAHEILAISFTRKSADNLAEKVKEKLGTELNIHTFHKLGLNIIAKAECAKPRLAAFVENPAEKIKHLDKVIAKLCDDSSFRRKFLEFEAYHRIPIKQEWEFKDLAEYKNWLRSNRIVSLDGVPKKSYQECVIANWLVMNGVAFQYEAPYEHSTKTPDFRQYCPDFYLPDLKLYIEHFGIGEDGKPAPYIDPEKYQEGMVWKREVHKRCNTTLLETYSWEHSKGVLLNRLEQKLTAHGCTFNPISDTDALALINESGTMTGFSELVAGFLTLYKGNGSKLIKDGIKPRTAREKAFLDLFDVIFREYERVNQQLDQIDFEDMITKAARAISAGSVSSSYKYILVDEFQDISPGRAELINALLHSVPDCALFAVGDDWQSIYRFAGSDIGAMTKFQEIFGPTRRLPLDTTFRFDNYAIATSSRFVLKNGVQIQKTLKPVKTVDKPSVTVYKRKADESPLEWSLGEIAKHAKGKASVLILERYNFHLPEAQEERRLSEMFPMLELKSMSVHGAKGLEADYVIVGLRGGVWGFPASKVDDPLFDLVLTAPDDYEHGEERRLFYVAITRARQKTYLVCETGADESVFATELLSEPEYRVDVFGVDTKKFACQVCKSGTMLLRDGSNGKFYGCSNFPLCSNTQQTCTKCGHGFLINEKGNEWKCHHCDYVARICPKCRRGVLQEKTGRHGQFIGCSNYRDPEINCRYTENRQVN
jgi:DNA helicase-4